MRMNPNRAYEPVLVALLSLWTAVAAAQEAAPADADAAAPAEATPSEPKSPAAASAAVADAQPTGAAVQLTLADAVAKALDSSVRLRQAELDRDAQEEKRRGAWSDVGPRLRAEYNQVKFEEAQVVNFGGQDIVMRPEESRVGSITALQPITGGMALSVKAKLEGEQEDLKEMAYKMLRTEVGFQTASAWLKAYQTRRQLEITQQSVAAAESQLRDAAALERAGRMNRGDVLKLELAVSEAKARAALAKAGVEVGDASLREAVGLPASAPIALAGDLPAVSANALPSADAAFKEAMDRRLEPKAAESGVALANYGKKIAYSNFSPSVNLFAKLERNFGEPAGLGSAERDTRTYGIQASWDLWNNGAHVFAVREAAEQVSKAEVGIRGAESQVRVDVQTALANYRAAEESLALARVAVEQAAEAYRIEQVRFRTGSRSATDLILAETSNASAQGRLVTAQTDQITWYLMLRKALGDEQPQL